MQQRFDTTIIVDGMGVAHIEGSLRVSPGRHRVVVLIDDVILPSDEPWEVFVRKSFGSLADQDFVRPDQGLFELRDEIA